MKYRKNVAVLLTRFDFLLVGERRDAPNFWQVPQGGIDEGESAELALIREIEEETGLRREDYAIGVSRRGYCYDFPLEVQKQRKKRGQSQQYFHCVVDVGVEPSPSEEFQNWRWVFPSEFSLAWIPDFKRQVYREVFRDFFQVDLR